jgi:hypothetical protein
MFLKRNPQEDGAGQEGPERMVPRRLPSSLKKPRKGKDLSVTLIHPGCRE